MGSEYEVAKFEKQKTRKFLLKFQLGGIGMSEDRSNNAHVAVSLKSKYLMILK